MEPLVFPYDHQIWEQQRRNQWLTLWYLPLLMFSCMFFTPFFLWAKLHWLVGLAAAIFLLYTLALVWSQRTKFRHRRNTKLLLEANGLSYANEVFVSGKTTTPIRIFYDEITGLDIAHDQQQRPVELKIQTRYHQLALSGFRNMPQLATKLTERVSATCHITRHRAWFSSPQPLGLLFFFILCTFIVILLASGPVHEPFVTQTVIASLYVYMSFLELGKGWRDYRDPKRKWGEMPTAFVMSLVWWGVIFLMIMREPEDWSLSAYWNAPCRLGQRLAGETGCVYAFSHDGRSYFLADSETMVRQQSNSVIIAPPSAWVHFWTPQLPYDGWLSIYGLSANRQMLLTHPDWGRDTFQVWNVGAQFLSRQFTLDEFVDEDESAISANGAYVAIRGADTLYIYDVVAGQITHQWPLNDKKDPLTFSPDAGALVLLNELDQPVIVDRDTGASQLVLPLPENTGLSRPLALSFSADGRFLAAAYEADNTIVVWEWANKQIVQVLVVPPEMDYALRLETAAAISPDHRFVVVAIGKEPKPTGQLRWVAYEEFHLYVWRLADGALIKQQFLGIGDDNRPVMLDFAPNGSLLMVGLEDVGMVFRTDQLFREWMVQESE